MTALYPNAVIRCAIIGRVQGPVQGIVGSNLLRLSHLSLLPTPAPALRTGTRPAGRSTSFSASGATRLTAALWRDRLDRRDRGDWRRDGLPMAARHRHQLVNAMPSQENPKSKAIASA